MKKIIVILSLALMSCEESGTTQLNSIDDSKLPNELKGLKVYDVSLGGGKWVKVAVLNNEVNSINYKEGKWDRNLIIINKKTVLLENDSIIIYRK